MDEAARANSQGLAALRAGDAHAAAKYFERACRGDPGAVELRINLATARRVLGDDEAERSALEAALAIDQRSLMALIRLAQLHERLGEEGPATRRWSAIMTLGSAIEQPSPELRHCFRMGKPMSSANAGRWLTLSTLRSRRTSLPRRIATGAARVPQPT